MASEALSQFIKEMRANGPHFTQAPTEACAQFEALLHCHGGSHVASSATGYRGLPANLGRAAGIPAHAVDHRLVPEETHPAAVDDAVHLARRAEAAGTPAQPEIWPEMIPSWQSFVFMLAEGRASIDTAAPFVGQHL